jgi:hypothetical protein
MSYNSLSCLEGEPNLSAVAPTAVVLAAAAADVGVVGVVAAGAAPAAPVRRRPRLSQRDQERVVVVVVEVAGEVVTMAPGVRKALLRLLRVE